MRQFKLREEKSFIKILKEPPLEKKKVNWSRRVYLAIFILVALLIARRAFNANMIIFANGQIELPKQAVKFSNDIKILDIRIAEGEEVCQGDTLFAYQIMGDEIDQAKLSLSQPSSSDWILREELTIKKKLAMNKLIIEQRKEGIAHMKELIRTKESLLLGGIHEEYDDYVHLQDQEAGFLAEIQYHEKENSILRNHLRNLNGQKRIYQAINSNQMGIYYEIKYFISPSDGVISDIFYEQNEICYKKEEMITIHQLHDATINTYFDPIEIKHLEVGDIVKVEFPDKSKSEGIISKFFVSTYAVPSEFQKKYEPTERNIVAEVVPLHKDDEQSWNSFYKMEVSVQKMRYEVLSMF